MKKFDKNGHLKLSDYLEKLLRKGSIAFTKKEAIKSLGASEIAFMRSSQRLQKKGLLIRPVAGFYVIVEVEYRDAGGPPAIHFIQKLMSYLELPYYVGILSAAKYHGATHQAVFETQVLTSKPLPAIKYGKHRIRFITNKFTEKVPTKNLQTPHGEILISTPESTLFDLVRYQKKSAGLSHIATVISEMKEKINSKKLSIIAEIYDDTPLAQRVGYLLEEFGERKSTAQLQKWLQSKNHNFIKLEPSLKPSTVQNSKWSININSTIEPDEV